MYIRIVPPDGSVKISAPRSMPQYRIEAFARERLDWILEHQKRYSVHRENTFEDGDTLVLWGKPYRLCLTEFTQKAHIVTDEEMMTAHFFIPLSYTTAERAHLWEDYCREQLRLAIPSALSRCEEVVGARANEWHIRKMKTRWGSCNYIKKRICLNAALASKPPICLDYVLTHELVHLYETKHNARFKAHLDAFFPTWREVKKILNAQ